MFDFCGYGDDSAGNHLNGSLAPFLIPAAPSNADEHLYLLVVNMPLRRTRIFPWLTSTDPHDCISKGKTSHPYILQTL